MSTADEELENLIDAISWKLYLEPHCDKYEQIWNKFVKDPNFQQQIAKVCNVLGKISIQMFAERLSLDNLEKRDGIKFLDLMWRKCIYDKVFQDIELQRRVRYILRNAIREALTSTEPESSINFSAPNYGESPQQTPTPATANWNYLPVEEVPDKHSEFDCKSGTSPEELNIIGARVRGKAHKHQGTNCDDWFEFKTSGQWTIVAVSDGAGSKKFSRIGAKASCKAAVEYLAEKLQNYSIKEWDKKEDLLQSLTRDEKWVFSGEDIESVQNDLYQAIQEAYKDVEQAATQRKLEVNDLSATLLLAVHTTVQAGEKKYSLILSCQIGDGMLAALSRENRLTLLGKPDSGEYGGQTEFLTSKNKLHRANLVQKTFVFAGDLKALMVMTDGVADDYFPSDPGILELYGDLVLNQVIPITKPQDTEIENELQNINPPRSIQDVKDIFLLEERILDPDTTDEPKEVNIASVKNYATVLGKELKEVVASTALLAAGTLAGQMYQECHNMPPEEKLQLWLDSYYRRGSFDDRTLVILYR